MEYLENNSSKNIAYQNSWVETHFGPSRRFVYLHITCINKNEKKLRTQYKEVKKKSQTWNAKLGKYDKLNIEYEV